MSFDPARWVSWIERRYKALLAGSLALTIVCALSLFALRLDLDVLDMLPHGAPAFDNFKTYVSEFGELNELIVLIESDSPEDLEPFADELVARVGRLDTVAQVQGRLDPEPIQSGILGSYLFNYVPLEGYEQLAKRLTPEGVDAQVAGNRAALGAPFDLATAQWVRRDPFGITRLAAQALAQGIPDNRVRIGGGYASTPDGTAILVMVRPRRSAFDIEFTTAFMAAVRAAEARARDAAGSASSLRVGYTGSYAFALEDAATLKWDIGKYTILALLGVLATFAAGYRSLRVLPFVTYPLLVSTLVTFAAGLLWYARLNAVSICFAAILYGLSIDSGIHYYTRLLQERRDADLRTAVARTLGGLGAANVVASATTAVAFCVVGFSQLTGVSQLGFLTALGMLVTIAEFFLLYPALTFALPAATFAPRALTTPRLGAIAAASSRHARGIGVGLAVLTAGLAWVASGVGLDVDLTHLRPGDSVAMRVQERIAERFGGDVVAGAVLVRAADTEGALQQSERLAPHLLAYQEEGLLKSFRGVGALLPSERTQAERLRAFEGLPRAQAAEWLATALPRYGFAATAFDTFLESWLQPQRELVRLDSAALDPLRPVLERYIRVRPDSVTVATYLEPPPGVSLSAVEARLRHDIPELEMVVASRGLLQDELGRMLRRELIGFCLASFALNLVLLLWNFPQLKVAGAILIPEAVVILACFAAMRLGGVAIDPVNLIVVPLILGIGVDNCVYVAERWRQGEDFGASLSHGGRALGVSALTTMAGFGFLGLSEYPALARLGAVAALGLFLCFVASVTILPALIQVFTSGRHQRRDSA